MAMAIEIRGVTKSFARASGDGAATKAVDDVSLRIEPGELFFLLGPSGCGKTTLLRMIAGFIEPDSGTIAFDGRDVTRVAPEKRNTGMVFQSYALWPHMSVEQNVAFGLSVRHVAGDESRRRVAAALGDVRMAEYAERRPTQLSGGQQQRVALARALVVRPDALLLDEPLSNLDARLRIELRTEIRRICKDSGITAIYVTHDQKEALSMADRIAIMRSGKIAQIGTPRELYTRPSSRFVAEFLGETNIVPGEVLSPGANGSELLVRTPIGTLRAIAASSAALHAGTPVVCSIRYEAFRADGLSHADDNTLTGEIVDTLYLGDTVHSVVRISDQTIHVSELNVSDARDRGPATWRVRARDVVAMAAEE
jgi:iron(III) transport system ATP-binding protein